MKRLLVGEQWAGWGLAVWESSNGWEVVGWGYVVEVRIWWWLSG